MTVSVIEDVIFGSVLGAALVADIAVPSMGQEVPAVISVHGGRWIRGGRHDDGKEGRADNGVVDLRQWAEAGFVAMRIDYRLVTCSPAPACFQDMLCALRWLHAHAKKYGINTEQIFLVGQSAGGHMVSLAATLGCDAYAKTGGWDSADAKIAGAISISGAYDLVTLDWGSGWCPPGVPWEVARAQGSPANHVRRDSVPLLVLHATDDRSVPISQADTFVEKLRTVGARHEYQRYDTGGHLKVTPPVYDASRAFIDRVIDRTI